MAHHIRNFGHYPTSAGRMNRRLFLQNTVAGVGAALATRSACATARDHLREVFSTTVTPSGSSQPITGATLGPVFRYNRPEMFIYGDSWTTTWADDAGLYCIADDTYGFDSVLWPTGGRNLSINAFGTTAPPDLRGMTINSMDDYGIVQQLGADGATWKGNGLACIDGVFYLTVSRHWYGNPSSNYVQLARDSSIVKSYDHGLTWSPTPPGIAEPFTEPMFPGPKFATPFFVQYGQNGDGTADGADSYIYAVSSDGVWDNGDRMYMGRVARDEIEDLDAAQWEFITGFSDEGVPRWERGLAALEAAEPILSAPGRCSQAGIHYIEPLGRYILPQWYYPRLSEFDVSYSRWEFYEAPAPWGPWALFQSWEFEPEGFYNPYILNKFMSDDGLRMWIVTTGNFFTAVDPDPETTLYTLHMIPLTLAVS